MRRFGGNTACIAIREVRGSTLGAPLILDAGSGLNRAGVQLVQDDIASATVILSHLHWDHIQGLPFFPLLDRENGRTNVFVPSTYLTPHDALARVLAPPVFPVTLAGRPGECVIQAAPPSMELEDPHVRVSTLAIAHSDPTIAIRVDSARSSLAYVTDHQEPIDGKVEPALVEFCRGVDLLVHDAQYTKSEFRSKATWGHSTYEFAVEVARASGAGRLAFFHHDPSRTDEALDEIVSSLAGRFDDVGMVAAWEGMDLLLA